MTLPFRLPGNPCVPSGNLPGLGVFEIFSDLITFLGRKRDEEDTVRTLQMGPGSDVHVFCGFPSGNPSGKLPGWMVYHFLVF